MERLRGVTGAESPSSVWSDALLVAFERVGVGASGAPNRSSCMLCIVCRVDFQLPMVARVFASVYLDWLAIFW